MGPLVPDIISNEFNFIIALIIGIGFGFALEQAGFASTKKLVGLFYGYDFTVLRVFFTAGVVAMVGVVLLNHLGLLDVSIIFINPTFLWAALVGGGIMGAGFIIGGFCPGTSACAAATGKIDGWAFIIGSFLGIFAFTEGYPLIKDLYMAGDMGDLLVFEMMGLSREMFGLIMVLGATGVFVMVHMIENRVNNRETKWELSAIKKNVLIVSVPTLIVLLVMITPTRGELMNTRIEEKIAAGECNPRLIDGDKLAFELMNNYYHYNVIDVRSPGEFKAFHIPTAINIPLEELHTQQNLNVIIQNIKTNVFYGGTEMQAKRACMVAKYHGKADNLALNITSGQFYDQFYVFTQQETPVTKDELNVYNFRKDAGIKLKEIGDAVANLDKPIEKKVRRIQGGCS